MCELGVATLQFTSTSVLFSYVKSESFHHSWMQLRDALGLQLRDVFGWHGLHHTAPCADNMATVDEFLFF